MEQIWLLLFQCSFHWKTKSLVFAVVNLCNSASAFYFSCVINQTAYFSIRRPKSLGGANQNSVQGNVRDVVAATSFQSLHPISASYQNRLSCYFKQRNARNCSEFAPSHLLSLSHFWPTCDAVHWCFEQFLLEMTFLHRFLVEGYSTFKLRLLRIKHWFIDSKISEAWFVSMWRRVWIPWFSCFITAELPAKLTGSLLFMYLFPLRIAFLFLIDAFTVMQEGKFRI